MGTTQRVFLLAAGKSSRGLWVVQALGVPGCQARARLLSEACERLGSQLARRFPELDEFGLEIADGIDADAPGLVVHPDAADLVVDPDAADLVVDLDGAQ